MVTCTAQPKLALPGSLPAVSVATSQQQGYGGIPAMVPSVEFNKSIDIGCISSVAPKTNPSIFVQPRPITNECTVPKGHPTNQGSEQLVHQRTLYSTGIPTSNQYIIHPGQFIPLTSIATPVTSVSQSSGLNTVTSADPGKRSSRSAPKKPSSVGAKSCIPHFREIKPKSENPEIKAANADNPIVVEQVLRKPKKRIRSLQSNKTLLSEPLDKYITDNLKKNSKNAPSTLKIKMNPPHSFRFLKRKKPVDMVAELYKNCTGGTTMLKSPSKSGDGQENTPKCIAS
jgi:hypothetical protein